MASDRYRLLTAEEFLRIDFGADMKAELDNGIIRMMAGGTRDHAIVQADLTVAFGSALRGSGCRPTAPTWRSGRTTGRCAMRT